MIEMLIAAWLTITPPDSMISGKTEVYLAEFTNDIPDKFLLEKSNFEIVDSVRKHRLRIFSVALLDSIDGLAVADSGTKLLALVVSKPRLHSVYHFNCQYGSSPFFVRKTVKKIMP